MTPAAEIRDISDTAIWVAYYRGKESDRADAMFRDPLAKRLTAVRGERIAQSFQRTSRYTEWSILARTVLIDDFILQAIAAGVDAVVNLGAGLDTRPYRMELPPTLQWVEAEFPHVLAFKNTALQDQTPKCALQRVGVDLADAVARRRFLAEAAPGAVRILVLTEGVVPYLTEAQVASLAADLLAQPRYTFWLAEYLSPLVYGRLQALAKSSVLSNAPFQFFPADWVGFFQRQGWARLQIRYSSEIVRRFGRRPPMPWWAPVLRLFMSRKAMERARTMSGFMLMAPATSRG